MELFTKAFLGGSLIPFKFRERRFLVKTFKKVKTCFFLRRKKTVASRRVGAATDSWNRMIKKSVSFLGINALKLTQRIPRVCGIICE